MIPAALLLTSVLTAANDNARSGANTAETFLTHATVAGNYFVKRGSWTVDGRVYGQPLIVDGVNIGSATRVLIVATMHNTIYCFDANIPGSTALWSVNVGAPLTTPPAGVNYDNLEIGFLSTPVVDATAGVVYATSVNSSGTWKLYAFNLADGTNFATPVTISGQVLDSNSNPVVFSSTQHAQRSALLLVGGKIYIGFAAYADTQPWHGWLMAYNSTTLAQTAIWCATPDHGGGAIWHSKGPASDGTNIYVATGNSYDGGGAWDGVTNFGESLVKLNASLVVQSYFTPSNWSAMDTADLDFGTSSPLLFSTFATSGSKDGRWWLLNQSALGGLEGRDTGPVQKFNTAGYTGSYVEALNDAQAFANNYLYVSVSGFPIYRYSFNGSTFDGSPISSSASFTYPGARLTYTSNGSTAGTDILWAVTGSSSSGALRAFKGSDLTQIFSAALPSYAKFAAPTVANGQVYVATFSNAIMTYGLTAPKMQITGGTVSSGGITIR